VRNALYLPSLLGIVLLFYPAVSKAQLPDSQIPAWVLTTRALMTGSSDNSQPAGYQVYSAFALEAALRRSLGQRFASELSIRTESREVDSLVASGEDRRLGSLELLPVNLFIQFRPWTGGRLHPYVGAGVNLTVAWEKSGVLDSTDMAASVGSAIGLGADLDLGLHTLLNLDLKWNSFTAKLRNGDTPLTDIQVDPLALAVGVGFRF
jgi:outer membrane protein